MSQNRPTPEHLSGEVANSQAGEVAQEIVFPDSPQRQLAFDNISALTNPRGWAIAAKRRMVKEIFGQGLLSKEVLREHPSVYLGARYDIEYPLALGCRHIVMVDPLVVADPVMGIDGLAEIGGRIRVLTNEEPDQTEDEFSFNFDYGEGDERVTVSLVPKYYNPEKFINPFTDEEPEQVPASEKYTLPDPVGMILGFASGYGKISRLDIDKLVSGGLILDFDHMRAGWDISDEGLSMREGGMPDSLAAQKCSDRGLALVHIDETATLFLRKI